MVEDSRFYATQLQRPNFVQEDKSNDDETSEAEAMKTLKVALVFKNKGHHDKAEKLFKHAFALCPKHPRLLNHYGEFLMEINQDPIEADHLFVKALRFSEAESDEFKRAILNRKITSVIVEDLDMKMLKIIHDKKKAFNRISRNNPSLRRAIKEAYFQVPKQFLFHKLYLGRNLLFKVRSILKQWFTPVPFILGFGLRDL